MSADVGRVEARRITTICGLRCVLRTWFLDTRNVLHVALVLVLATFAAALLQPGDTFSMSPAFRQLSAVMNEEWWAITTGGVAALGFLGLFSRRMLWRSVSVMALALMHSLVAVCFFASGLPHGPWSTGIAPWSVYALLGYYLLWRRFL